MQNTAIFLLLAVGVTVAGAQTPPAHRTAHPATAGHAVAAKLPAGIPVVHGVIKTAFSLKYEDYKIGTGPLAEPNKVYHVLYTGYLASTGQIFDSTAEHRMPVSENGKPVMGPDGKPELGAPQPFVFPQGFGRLIPGFDQGLAGMHVGGKRRIFVPWQLAYGTRSIPAHGADHPGIPAKSDLIFDVELLEVTDMPTMPAQPVPPHPAAPGHAPTAPAAPSKPETSSPPATSPAPAPKSEGPK